MRCSQIYKTVDIDMTVLLFIDSFIFFYRFHGLYYRNYSIISCLSDLGLESTKKLLAEVLDFICYILPFRVEIGKMCINPKRCAIATIRNKDVKINIKIQLFSKIMYFFDLS